MVCVNAARSSAADPSHGAHAAEGGVSDGRTSSECRTDLAGRSFEEIPKEPAAVWRED